MVRRRTHSPGQDAAEGGNGPQAQEVSVEERHNGAAPADGQQALSPDAPTMARAEEMVDHLAERVGHYASLLGHKLRWLAARAREEAEDIWAEAQALRRGEHQP